MVEGIYNPLIFSDVLSQQKNARSKKRSCFLSYMKINNKPQVQLDEKKQLMDVYQAINNTKVRV